MIDGQMNGGLLLTAGCWGLTGKCGDSARVEESSTGNDGSKEWVRQESSMRAKSRGKDLMTSQIFACLKVSLHVCLLIAREKQKPKLDNTLSR